MISFEPNHLPKVLPPNTILEIRVSTYEFGERGTQTFCLEQRGRLFS